MNTRQVAHPAPASPAAPAHPPLRLKSPPPATKPHGMSWRDYLILLLHTGAELEHSLMVQYLYAAYSLNEDQPDPAHRATVQRWRDLILTVAKEEMGHLLTVQNLLCLVGGPVSFERENFPIDTPYLPFPFKLQKLSLESISWYVYAEAPQNWDDPEADPAARLQLEADLRAVNACAADAVRQHHAHTVGQLYDRIYSIVADEHKIPDSDFRADTYAQQASWDDWGRGYRPAPAPPGETTSADNGVNDRAHVLILRAATRTEALAALKEVGGQGEAAHFVDDDCEELSHFERFRSLMDEFQEVRGWNPVHDVPDNPTTRSRDEQAPGSTRIEAVTSRLLANLLNVRYRALLTCLAHSFKLARRVSPDEPNTRGAIMHQIFGEMYNLKALSGLLVQLPLRDESPAAATPTQGGNGHAPAARQGERATADGTGTQRAAPPFEMPYTMHIPNDEVDRWRLYRDILTHALKLCDELLDGSRAPSRDFIAAHPAAVRYLQTLQQLDRKAVAWIDTILAGLHHAERRHV